MKSTNILTEKDNASLPPVAETTPQGNSHAPRSREVFRNDSWTSALKGIGTARDSRMSATFMGDTIIPKVTLSEMYCGDGLVKRIIDLIPEEMFRVPGVIQNDPKEEYDEGLIAYEMERLNALSHFKYAKKMARLTGGAIVYIGAMGAGSPGNELDPKEIDSIEFLKVFDLNDIQTWDCKFNTDLGSPNFGKIELYSVQVRVGVEVNVHYLHASRCIPFYGSKIPPSSVMGYTLETRYWGLPIMQYMYSDIRDFRLAFANTAGILGEFVVGKYKFADLDEILSAGNEKKLHSRISAIEMSKSAINSVLMGTDEEYTRDSASVGGLADLLDRFMMLVSMTTGYPVTKLFGRSASGLNATGEGDQKSYYDLIRSEMVDIKPEIQSFVDLLVNWKGLSGKDYTYTWGNLYQPTPEEEANRERIEAESERTRADADQRYMADGVLSAEQVYKLRKFEEKLGEKWADPLPDVDDIPTEEDMDAGNVEGDDKATEGDDDTAPKTDNLPKDLSLEISREDRKGIIKYLKEILPAYFRFRK
jgi:phage-related protein (TIGR01555 family)